MRNTKSNAWADYSRKIFCTLVKGHFNVASHLRLVGGLILLVWSADKFVVGASSMARHYGMPPLLIGMVIVGFGTSAPELVVSSMSAIQGNPELALGNAYGSNTLNIALILGLTAILAPVAVPGGVLRREIPILLAITALAALQLHDGSLTRLDALVLLLVFALILGFSIHDGIKHRERHSELIDKDSPSEQIPIKQAYFWTIVGLLVLIVSSRLLVWGATAIASQLGVSDLVIGLTIVALGTSLPELASSVMAARKGENDIALGNILGSNMFNGLAVVGIAGFIAPMQVGLEIFQRDLPVVFAITLLLMIFGLTAKKINRVEGVLMVLFYLGYAVWLFYGTTQGVQAGQG